MKDYIEERAVEIAHYIIEHKATVRQTAKQFGVSKSTIHKDVTALCASIPLLQEKRAKCWIAISQSVIFAAVWLQERNIYIWNTKK